MKYLLHWKLYSHREDIQPSLFTCDLSGNGYVFDREIELEAPANIYEAATIGAVAELRSEQAKHQNAITELERRIMELQCIENKTGE